MERSQIGVCLFLLRLRGGGWAGCADVDHRQHAEHERLDAAGKEIKIDGEDGGDADLENGDGRDEFTRDPAKHERAQRGQTAVDEGREHGAAGDIAEVTERHGDRLRDLADDIHRRHNDHGLREALQPAEEAVVLDVVVPDESGRHEGPGERRAEVGRRAAQEAGQAGERAEHGRAEQRADVGRKALIVLAHRVVHELVNGKDGALRDGLH